MKSFLKMLAGTTLVLSAGALADTNGGASYPLDAPTALSVNIADVLCTAAINSTGSKAGGETVVSSTRLGLGTYEVKFGKPCTSITAKNGWARMVHADTLRDGTLGSTNCITADRAGQPNAVWVQCYNATGALADTSFYLFVLR